MNKRGLTVFYTMMIAIVFFIAAMAFAPPLKQFTDDARNSSTSDRVGLDCNNSSISSFDKGECVLIDYSLPFFTLGLIGIAGAIFVARIVFGEGV